MTLPNPTHTFNVFFLLQNLGSSGISTLIPSLWRPLSLYPDACLLKPYTFLLHMDELLSRPAAQISS